MVVLLDGMELASKNMHALLSSKEQIGAKAKNKDLSLDSLMTLIMVLTAVMADLTKAMTFFLGKLIADKTNGFW